MDILSSAALLRLGSGGGMGPGPEGQVVPVVDLYDSQGPLQSFRNVTLSYDTAPSETLALFGNFPDLLPTLVGYAKAGGNRVIWLPVSDVEPTEDELLLQPKMLPSSKLLAKGLVGTFTLDVSGRLSRVVKLNGDGTLDYTP